MHAMHAMHRPAGASWIRPYMWAAVGVAAAMLVLMSSCTRAAAQSAGTAPGTKTLPKSKTGNITHTSEYTRTPGPLARWPAGPLARARPRAHADEVQYRRVSCSSADLHRLVHRGRH